MYYQMPPQPERTSFWKTVPGVLTAVGTFIAAIGTLIGALAAAGFFEREGTATPGTTTAAIDTFTTSSAPPPTTAVVDPPTRQVDRASIDLVYSGDNFGCSLQLVVEVGSQSVQPSGSRYTVRNVETGVQDYAIRGSILCPTIGNCTAQGSGSIDVAEGRSYYVTWLNTAIGVCDVTLLE